MLSNTGAVASVAAIREALVRRLLERTPGPGLILHELAVGSGLTTYLPVAQRWYVTRGLRYFAGGHACYPQPASARADLALLTRDALDLFEIKGAGDSLARLRTQVRAYDDTGSRNTLVVDPRHAAHALDAVPPCWGVWVACGSPLRFDELRQARPNPSRTVRGLTHPLYRRELVPLAFVYRLRRGSHDDYVDSFDRFARHDFELHERWMRARIAARDHSRRVLPPVPVGNPFPWSDERLDALVAGARRTHAGAQLALAL